MESGWHDVASRTVSELSWDGLWTKQPGTATIMDGSGSNYWLRLILGVVGFGAFGIGFTEWSLHGGKHALSIVLPALVLVSVAATGVLCLREVTESRSRKIAILMFCVGVVFMGSFMQLLQALLLP